MRLICPNCDAEYEVDDTAIPDAGRDVQCSNCGHAWFQAHAIAAADPVMDEPAQADVPADDVAAEVPAPDMPQPRTVDDSVLAILKEEADRELAARRAEALPIETQPDLGLDAGDALADAEAARIASIKNEEAAERAKHVTRRELLPNIEEINSTLRPSSAVRHDDDDDDHPTMMPTPPARSGFRSGFVLMLVLAAVLVAVYLMAPRLSQQIPGAKGALDAYVAGVDQARTGLDSATKSVIGALQRLAGGE